MYTEDTIAAIATPLGPGGIGIVRVSGPRAESIANLVFRCGNAGAWESHRLYHGRILTNGGTPLDDGLAVLMRRPRSYTGEDVLEIHCHGSPLVLRLALETVLGHGARPAQAGEFTKRAFLNGKLDLAQAEAVIDMVSARTPESAAQAANQLFGQLSGHLQHVRQRLIRVKAHLEAQIDFSDEELGIDHISLMTDVTDAERDIESLLGTYERGRVLRHGARVAITGRPNAGKSSLLNALLGDERAIVTAAPGTTRDVIEEGADFGGVPVVLSDTAGLRDVPDEVERIGVERAHEAVRAADVVLFVIDASLPPDAWPESVAAEHAVIVFNKIDLPCAWSEADASELARRAPVVRVSAKYLTGLDDLRRAVAGSIVKTPRDNVPTLTRSRQRDAMVKALTSLRHAREGLRRRLAPELIAVDLQDALDDIGCVTGAITSEEILDEIFAEFCIGK